MVLYNYFTFYLKSTKKTIISAIRRIDSEKLLQNGRKKDAVIQQWKGSVTPNTRRSWIYVMVLIGFYMNSHSNTSLVVLVLLAKKKKLTKLVNETTIPSFLIYQSHFLHWCIPFFSWKLEIKLKREFRRNIKTIPKRKTNFPCGRDK